MRSILIQIPRWLKQPNVWRLVCSASCAVGFLFYALSSSFNHLFGKWTLLKVLLYSVFSLIILITISFAKACQHSPRLRLKAHLAFLVLMTTSVYSFFFDKVLNGKPDTYSLISSAAFAIMSLGLSKQTHYGFEIDLLYFFSGCLTVQLLRIKLYLGIVGACFSYSLIILRSSLDTSPENLHLGLQNHVIIQVDLHSHEANTGTSVQLDSPQANTSTGDASNNFITPVEANFGSAPIMTLEPMPQNGNDPGLEDHIVTQVDSHLSQGNNDGSNDRSLIIPQFMTSIAALTKKNRKVSKHVEKYLEAIVDSQRLNQLQLQTDVNLVIDALPSRIINDLHEAMKLMVAAGFEKECCHVYSSCRREFLEECLLRFGLQELSMEDVNVMKKIQNWRRAFNITVKILFPNERRLCDHFFDGFSSIADISFVEVCRDLTIHLLSFANTFTTENHSLNLVCHIIPEVWETLRDPTPEFKSLFSDQYTLSLRNELLTVLKMLRKAARGLFMELNSLICHEMSVVVPYGRLHPVTCEVMNCVRKVCKSRDITPKHILEEYSMGHDQKEKFFLFSDFVVWIIEQLQSNLEANSENYEDPALGYVFLMNNMRYISEMMQNYQRLQAFMGRDWTRKYNAKVQQNLENYQRSSWNKVLEFLKLENEGLLEPYILAKSMKDKLNLFNQHFEEVCSTQSKWFLNDERQREQMRISLENMLLPIYGNFIRRFQDVLGKNAEEYIKYGMFQIVGKLNNLFLGSKGMKQQLEEK